MITSVSELAYATIAGFGVTAGVHRYWTHVSYKAKLPLRVILAACFLAAGMVEYNYTYIAQEQRNKHSLPFLEI